MATTTTLWGSGTPVTTASAGSWTTATAATGANNAAFATWTSTASAASGTIRVEGHGAQTAIGTQPTSIDSVVVTVYGYVTSTARVPTIAVQLTSGGTLIGSPQTMTASATTTNSQAFTFTGVAWAQLAALGVRVSFTRAAVTQAGNGLVDAVGIVVNYTPAAATLSVSGVSDAVFSAAGDAIRRLVTGGSSAFVTTAAGDVTVLAPVTLQVSGVSDFSTTATGAPLRRLAVAGASSATSLAAGTVAARLAVGGASSATFAAAGVATRRLWAGGATDWATDTTGDVLTLMSVEGVTDMLTDAAGDVSALLSIEGISDFTSAATGDVDVTVPEPEPAPIPEPEPAPTPSEGDAVGNPDAALTLDPTAAHLEVALSKFTVGDTAPDLSGSVGTDVTGATIEVRMRRPDRTVLTHPATVTDDTTGAWSMAWEPGDLSQPGLWRVEVLVTYSDGTIQTVGPQRSFYVRKAIA